LFLEKQEQRNKFINYEIEDLEVSDLSRYFFETNKIINNWLEQSPLE